MKPLAATQDLVTNFYTFEGVVQALNGVGIVVNQGETYALVGESGCGKSVTVRSMMRIVQSPGRIEGGKILIYFSDTDHSKAIDIVGRSEAFMESLRGNDISMIFQEAGAALNPVMSVSEQVGESLLAHRAREMLDLTVQQILTERASTPWPWSKVWKSLQIGLYRREMRDLERYERAVQDVDTRLYALETSQDESGVRERESIKRWRERLRRRSFLVSFILRVPFLRRYRRRVRKTVHQEVVALLTSLGIPNPAAVAQRYPHELSGGMQQRIVIAIALACHPLMLIADEPTSNLDVTIQAQIVELIRKLKETTISSVLYITHDLGLVAEICDRVTVMYAGDTCETASVPDLFREPLHPYTKGLLDAVPKVQNTGELATIPGSVPNLVHPPTGCRFHPRCPHVMDVCRAEKPPRTEHAPGHTVSCHLYTAKDGAR